MASNKAKIATVAAASVLAAAGLLVGKWEGVRYTPYRDVVGVLTVCYGHTGRDIVPDKRYTKAECDALLQGDLSVARQYVNLCIGPTEPHVEVALISAVFNIGPRVVCGSTLQRKAKTVGFPAACAELDKWKFAGGRVYRGLVLRRADERAVCEGRA